MPADPTQPLDLSWFDGLPPDHQIALLRDPMRPLSPDQVAILDDVSVPKTNAHWAGTSPTPLMLTEALQLLAIRNQFDDWWNENAVHQDYFIEHRDGDLAATYAEILQASAGDAVAEVLVWNPQKDSFRLVPVLRAYVEMQARMAQPGPS